MSCGGLGAVWDVLLHGSVWGVLFWQGVNNLRLYLFGRPFAQISGQGTGGRRGCPSVDRLTFHLFLSRSLASMREKKKKKKKKKRRSG